MALGVAVLPGTFDYAWVAGERDCVAAVRRHLVRERGMDPQDVMLMGCWRADGAIDDLPD